MCLQMLYDFAKQILRKLVEVYEAALGNIACESSLELIIINRLKS